MPADDPRAWTERVEARPGAPKPDALLTVDGVARSFGGVRALDVDHLEVQRGSITALIGPNGAGKTTLFDVLSGFERAESGRWSFDGAELTRAPPHRVARGGMVRTWQLTRPLARMTVIENVMVAGARRRGERLSNALLARRWRAEERACEERAEELLERFGLAHARDELAGTLSGGQRKLLEIARALMADPALLMLDEPMAGLNRAFGRTVLDHVEALRADGVTILFVEHDMDVVAGIGDWVVCMAEGRVIAEGTPAHVGRDPAVVDAYLGARAEAAP
ncbi:MAG TPA: ABC transporter ATP-binding protein [Actinomycetota bacterium]|nr:ABC transporter ATP-binding protein [Actinomycetota bacterium]